MTSMRFAMHNPGLTQGRADVLYDQVFNVRAFGARGDGTTNDIDAFQAALDAAAFDEGAGKRPAKTLVWAPPGRYKFATGATGLKSLTIPKGVTLQGSYGGPITHFTPIPPNPPPVKDGTTFLVETNHGNANGEPFCLLNTNCAVRGISFFWPNQVDKDQPTPVAYPFALGLATGNFDSSNMTIENIELQNAYQGINLNFCARHLVSGVFGQAFYIGLQVDGVGSIGRLENVHFLPVNTLFEQNPTTGVITPGLAKWQFDNGTAFIFKRTDSQKVLNCFCILYKVGVLLTDGDQTGDLAGGPWIEFQGMGTDRCQKGVLIDTGWPYSNMQFTNCFFAGEYFGPKADPNGGPVVVNTPFATQAKFGTCLFEGFSPALRVESGNVLVSGSSFEDFDQPSAASEYSVVANGGTISVTGCQFLKTDKHVFLKGTSPTPRKAIVLGNIVTGSGPFDISNGIPGSSVVDHNL